MPDNIPPVLRDGDANNASASTYRVCGFCGCTLTANGEVFKMSNEARDYRDQKESFEKQRAKSEEEKALLKNRVEELERENSALRKAAEPQPEPVKTENGFHF